jgi:tRNA threonylcarbamoyladenosine biosynthesis protein TsaB
MTVLLALDTATDRLLVALRGPRGDRWVDETGGAASSTRIVPALLGLLDEAGLGLDEVDAIAFGRGPGAFTGLRTACAVAQGLAFGAAKPVLALDSLLLHAEDARRRHPGVAHWWVAIDARMDEAYAGAYRHAGGRWCVDVAPALYELRALQARWAEAAPMAVAGNALAAFGPRLDPGAQALRVDQVQARGAALLALAQAAWDAGEAIAPDQALPLYLRDKVALTTAERAEKAERAEAAR